MTKYAMNGKGSDDTIDDTIIEGKIMGGARSDPADEDQILKTAIRSVAEDLMQAKKKHQQTLADAVHRSLKKRVQRAEWNHTIGSEVAVRHHGILHRADEQDLKRVEAGKANKDRTILNAELLKYLGEYLRRGKYHTLDVLKDVYEMDDDVPEDLLPIAQGLTKFIAELLPETFAQGGTMISEFGLEEIALATKPPRDKERRR